MKVKDVMVSPVYSVSLKDPLTKVVDKMIKFRISGIIVLEKEKPVGMIYSTDLIKYIFAPEKAKEITAEEIVEKQEEIVLKEDTPLKEALKIMIDKNRKKLPVVNQKGEIIGVFSLVDVVKYFIDLI
jgi:CBS domain-containing protein